MKTLEVAGLWWMPTRPDHKVPGTLTFDLRKAGRLKLIGGLRTPLGRAEDLTDASTYGRLHGMCGRRSFTLEGCFQQSLRGAPSDPDEQVIYVNNAYEDVWFSADERAEADVLHFDVDGLTEWVAQSGLEQTFYQSPADGEPWVKLEGVPLPERTAELPGSGTVTLGQTLSTKSRDTSLSLAESFSFKLAYDSNVAVPDLLDTASDIQDLVSLATDASAQFGFVKASHPDLVAAHGREFTVWSAWTALRTEGMEPPRHDLLFTLDDIGGMNGLAEWMRVAEKYRTPLGRAMATKYAERMYVSDRFLNRAAALEGFDRIRAPGHRYFADRVRKCIDIAGPQFESLVHDPTKWTTELKHHRNEVAHHYGRRMRQATEEQVYIADAAYWLLLFCLLRLASVADATFDKLLSHRKLQFLANKLRAILC
jgi:hypothetical protein